MHTIAQILHVSDLRITSTLPESSDCETNSPFFFTNAIGRSESQTFSLPLAPRLLTKRL